MERVRAAEPAADAASGAAATGREVERQRLERLLLALVLVLALAARLLYVSTVPQVEVRSDASGYDAAARRLVSGGGVAFPLGPEVWAGDVFSEEAWATYAADPPNAFSMPGYPAFVAAVYRVAGTGGARFFAVRVAQSLLGALSLLVLFRLARDVFGRRAAWVALVLAAAYPPAVWSAGYLLTETLFTLLFLLQVWSMVAAERGGSPRSYALVGLATAAAAYVRPIALVVPLVLVAVTLGRAVRGRSRADAVTAAGRLLLAGAVALALLAPWAVRNAVVYRKFVPLTSASALSRAQGLTSTVAGYLPAETLAQLLPWRPHGDDHRASLAIASDLMRRLPRVTLADRLGLNARSLQFAWTSATSPFVFAPTPFTWPSWQFAMQLVLLALAVAGVVARRREPWALGLAAIPVTVLGAHMVSAVLIPRYLYPVMPLLIVLAAAALAEVGRMRPRAATGDA